MLRSADHRPTVRRRGINRLGIHGMESEATANGRPTTRRADGALSRDVHHTMQRGNGRRPEPAICITVRFYRHIELLSPTADISTPE